MTTTNDTAFNVVELRRYAMLPGRLDELIAIFERAFIESQEACGMVPVGHYRNIENADEYVWLRGFADMRSRLNALEAFYGRSEAWLQNREAANATFTDTDNVLLLRPATPRSGFDLTGLRRPAAGESAPSSCIAVTVCMLREQIAAPEIEAFEAEVLPDLQQYARRVATFVTEDAPNDFRLPVRTGEWALVVTGICEDAHALNEWARALEVHRLPSALRANVIASEHLRLSPAARALYR